MIIGNIPCFWHANAKDMGLWECGNRSTFAPRNHSFKMVRIVVPDMYNVLRNSPKQSFPVSLDNQHCFIDTKPWLDIT